MKDFNFTPFPLIMGENIILRKLQPGDAPVIFDYQSNPENFPFVDMPIYTELKQAEDYIAKMNGGVEQNKWIIWAITSKDTDEIMGTISIWGIEEEKSAAELGYGLYPGNTGKGIMTQALNLAVEFGYEVMGLNHLDAYTNIKNLKSCTLLERNGFNRVEVVTEDNGGGPMDMAVYRKRR